MSKRNILLTTTAAAALVGALTSGAMAFDGVSWNWTNTVTQTTNIGITVSHTQTNPDLGQVEAGQATLGDATSTANTNNVNGALAAANLTIDNNALSALNNQSLNSDDTLLVHTGQFGLGGFDDSGANWQGFQQALGGLAGLAAGAQNTNLYPLLALATLAAAGNGYVVPAEIRAAATLTSSGGRELTNSATGMINSASWNITGDEPGLNAGLIVGDITQLGIGDITSTATASQLAFEGSRPSLDNLATSVGNNLSVRVNSPVVE